MLYIIGLGLGDKKDITVKGLEAVKKCDKIYLEYYTSKFASSKEELEEFYGKEIILANREIVEKKPEETILKDAGEGDVAFLVIGDVFSATTHLDLMIRAKERGIPIKIINNVSIMTGVGKTGLSLYNFGKTTSIVYPEKNWMPETPYDVLKQNKSQGFHTLLLLDIKMDEGRFMTINEAIKILLDIEEKRGENVFDLNTFCVGCARIGQEDELIKVGTAKELLEFDFGSPLHCLIVPGKMHFLEEEFLENFK